MITMEPMEVTTTRTLTVALTTTMATLARATISRRPARNRNLGKGMIQDCSRQLSLQVYFVFDVLLFLQRRAQMLQFMP